MDWPDSPAQNLFMVSYKIVLMDIGFGFVPPKRKFVPTPMKEATQSCRHNITHVDWEGHKLNSHPKVCARSKERTSSN